MKVRDTRELQGDTKQWNGPVDAVICNSWWVTSAQLSTLPPRGSLWPEALQWRGWLIHRLRAAMGKLTLRAATVSVWETTGRDSHGQAGRRTPEEFTLKVTGSTTMARGQLQLKLLCIWKLPNWYPHPDATACWCLHRAQTWISLSSLSTCMSRDKFWIGQYAKMVDLKNHKEISHFSFLFVCFYFCIISGCFDLGNFVRLFC